MRRKIVLPTLYFGSFLVITAALFVAFKLSEKLAEQTVMAELTLAAERTLRRIEPVTEQVEAVLTNPVLANTKEPCSAESIQKMREVALTHNRIQAIGYMQGTRLICSTIGHHENGGIDLGPPDFVGRAEWAIRTDRKLPYQNSGSYRFNERLSTGYVAIVNSRTGFESVFPEQGEGSGFISDSDLKPIGYVGVWRQIWSQKLGKERAVIFNDGEYFVALNRSVRFDYFSYAAAPASKVNKIKQKQMTILLPVGIVLSIFAVGLLVLATRHHTSLQSRLRSALKQEGEIYVLYQPIVDMQSRCWVGAEALVRWKLPTGEAVSPDVFVDLAEREGLIGELTNKVLQIIQSEAKPLFASSPEFYLSINVAPSDIADPKLPERLKNLAGALEVSTSALRIEATERTFIDANIANISLQRLREQGHSVAIDDFGTGYSSLSYLARLSVDVLKIDRAFVSTIGTTAVTSQVVQHIIDMAKSLQLCTVAEGVETEEQATYLQKCGVSFAQGWLYARALPIQELKGVLLSQRTLG